MKRLLERCILFAAYFLAMVLRLAGVKAAESDGPVTIPKLDPPKNEGGEDGLRVLVLLPYILTGGVLTILQQICGGLRRRGFAFVVFTEESAAAGDVRARALLMEEVESIVDLPDLSRCRSAWPGIALSIVAQSRFDLVMLVGSPFGYDFLPTLKTHFPKLAVVDYLFNTVGHTANNRLHAYAIDRMVVENASVHDWLLGHGEHADRVAIVPNGVDLTTFQPPKNHDSVANAPLRVGFMGRLSIEKGPDLFLRIARRLPKSANCVFAIAGNGPMAGRIRRMARRLRGQAKIEYRAHSDARVFLHSCDVLVVPSRIDGRPNVILEALACGVPVVASDVGGIGELVRDGETGYLCPARDTSAFVDAIRRLARDSALRSALSLSARAFAERALDQTLTLERHARLLRGVAPPPPPAQGSLPRVSVVMPVYNAASTLEQAVLSVLGQTHRDFELILLDDASTDASPAIARRLAAEDSRIRTVFGERNLGCTARLVQGLELAQAPYVARLDADDEAADPRRFEMQARFLAANPSVGVVGSWVRLMGETPERDLLLMPPADAYTVRTRLRTENCLIHSAVMFDRRKALHAGGYRPHMVCAQDYDLWLRLIKTADAVNLPLPLTRYRMATAGITISGRWRQKEHVLLAQAGAEHPRRSIKRLRRLAQRRLARIDRDAYLTEQTRYTSGLLLRLGLIEDCRRHLQQLSLSPEATAGSRLADAIPDLLVACDAATRAKRKTCRNDA